MREGKGGGRSAMLVESSVVPKGPPRLSNALHFDHHSFADDDYNRDSSSSATASTGGYFSDRSNEGSPFATSPWNNNHNQQWSYSSATSDVGGGAAMGFIGSLVREDGHIYSLAASGGLLYTGSDSKNIRVWKSQKEFSGFKSSSGLVKAIVLAGDRVFTGHQDGKIRVWRVSPKNAAVHKRVGSLPRLKDLVKSSFKPSNYIEGRRRRRSALWLRHSDTVSCLSMNEDQGLLYSGSWDRTFKVWRVSDSKCLESVAAHDDAVNSVVAAFDGLVFTGSADGSVKAWRRELRGKGTHHAAVQTLLKHDCAVTALAVSPTAPVVYCASSDGLLNFWEWEARQLSHSGELRCHSQAVLCLAAVGSLVLSGSADATICVWRREGGAHSCLFMLSGHSGPVKCLAVDEDWHQDDGAGRWIVYSGSLDKSVRMWRVSEQPSEALLRGPQHVPVEPISAYRASGSGGTQQVYGSSAGQDLGVRRRTQQTTQIRTVVA